MKQVIIQTFSGSFRIVLGQGSVSDTLYWVSQPTSPPRIIAFPVSPSPMNTHCSPWGFSKYPTYLSVASKEGGSPQLVTWLLSISSRRPPSHLFSIMVPLQGFSSGSLIQWNFQRTAYRDLYLLAPR